VAQAARPLADAGLPVVIVASSEARAALAQALAPHVPGCAVLAQQELVSGVHVDRIGAAELTPSTQEAA